MRITSDQMICLTLQIRPQLCRCTQIDMMDVTLRQIRVDEEEDADAAREAALDGALARVKEGDEVESADAAHARRGECRCAQR